MRTIPGVAGVQSTVHLEMPQLTLTIDRDRASSYGLTAADVELGLSLAAIS